MDKQRFSENDRERLKQEVRDTMVNEYVMCAQEAVEGIDLYDYFPDITDDSPDEKTRIKNFRNVLEANVIAQMIGRMLADGETRETFQKLTEGSILGEVLPEAYREWDEIIGDEQIGKACDFVESEAEEYHDLLDEIDVEFDDDDDEYDDDDEDDDELIDGLRKLIRAGGIDAFSDDHDGTMELKRLVNALDDLSDDDEEIGDLLSDIDDYPFHH